MALSEPPIIEQLFAWSLIEPPIIVPTVLEPGLLAGDFDHWCPVIDKGKSLWLQTGDVGGRIYLTSDDTKDTDKGWGNDNEPRT